MSAQKAIAGVRRRGKEAYQFQFTSEFEYITLECKGTWRPTLLKVVWFRNHRKVESIPVKWIVSEDRGPNGASGKAKFKPAFSVGLVVTLYKEKLRERFEEKEYKYYIQDKSEKGNKVLASFTIDLKEYTTPLEMNTRDALEMTFHKESRKVDRVVMGMTLSSQLLKRGKAIDYDMQSTFSAMTSDFGSQMLLHGNDSDMDEEEEEEERGGEEGRVGYHGVCEMDMDQRELDGAPRLKLGLNDVSTLDRGTRNGKECPTVTMQAPTPGSSLAPRTPHHPTSQKSKSCLRPTPPPCSNVTSSPSPSPSHSPSPSPSTSRSGSPGRPRINKASSDSTITAAANSRTTGKPKNENGKRNFFGRLRHTSVESSLDHHHRTEEEVPSIPHSPSPPSPPPTITDSSHRPWEEINSMVKKLQDTVTKLETENKRLHASLEIQGWLFKRGVRGVTANVWRRRFFRVEGSKIYYYKSMCASQAQGFIDIDLVLGVSEVCSEEQDKYCSTFIVRCEGRSFQLQAIDQPTMRRWISAIQFLADHRKSYMERRRTDIIDRLDSYL